MSDDPNSTGQPSEQLAIVIYPDADEHNANWLRILAQRRKEQQQDEQQQKEPPTNG